jgi:hypothetical protein
MATKVQINSIRHVVLHYDLDTTQGGSRDDAYAAIDAIKNPAAPIPLTKSVRLFVIPAGVEPIDFAFAVWKAVAAATKGRLRAGDAFFVHAVSESVLYQRLDEGSQLDPDPLARILEGFIK